VPGGTEVDPVVGGPIGCAEPGDDRRVDRLGPALRGDGGTLVDADAVQAQRRTDVADQAYRIDGVLGVRVGIGGDLHRLGRLCQWHLLPALDGQQLVEELARLVGGVGELRRSTPALAGALLEQADGVAVATGQVAQAGLLDGGGHGHHPTPRWDAFAGADGDDGGHVGELFGVPAVEGRDRAAAACDGGGYGRRNTRGGEAGGAATAEDCGGAEQRMAMIAAPIATARLMIFS
jgi:hypothetical protein